MKKLLIVFIILSFTSCIAQKTLKMEQEIIIPKINNKSTSIEINNFSPNSPRYEIINEESCEIYTKANVGFGKVTFLNNSYFKIIESFYPNTYTRKKGISFNNGSEFGTWYEFNKEGNLINEINTDEGYGFGWLGVIKYCHKNDIQLEKGYPKRGGIKTEIYKNEEEGKKVWTISYYKPKTDEYIEVTLDGKTGKEIKRRDLEFIGN